MPKPSLPFFLVAQPFSCCAAMFKVAALKKEKEAQAAQAAAPVPASSSSSLRATGADLRVHKGMRMP